jgi:hypothetical protein
MKRFLMTGLAAVLAFAASTGIAAADPAERTTLCHRDDDGSFRPITVSERAEEAHRAHGDAAPGEPVPGMEGKVFDEDCNPQDAPLTGYEVLESPPMPFGDGGFGGWSCPAGKVVIGGGFEATDPVSVSAPGTPGSVWPHHTFGSEEYGWVVQDDIDGSPNTITIHVICADEPAGYEVVESSPMAFGDGGFGGWSCPAGKVVLGGGSEATDPVAVSAPGTPGSVWPHHTFGADEFGWVVRDDPNGAPNAITIHVICLAPVAGHEVVNSSPMAFGDGGFGGWSCPAGRVVTAGGFDASDTVQVSAPGTPASVWPHHTFGSEEYGWVVQDDQNGAGNTITVYAVCAETS